MPSAIEKRKADREPPRPTRVAALGDITVASFLLDGRPMDAEVVNALIDVSLSRQIDGASAITATLADPNLKLLNSPIFAKAVDLWVDGLPFRLTDITLTDDNGAAGLSLEFEPRAIAKMRAENTPMHASRSDKTRAEFIKALCDKAGVKFVCPRLHEKPPIQSVEDAKTPAQKKADRAPGLSKNAHVKVKGANADSAQLAVLDQAMTVAHSLDAVALAQLALIEALIVESGCRNLSGGDRDSRGALQVRDSTAGPMGISNRDVEACVNAFLTKGFWSKGGAISLAAAHPDWDPGQIAQNTQGSAFPDAYEHFRSEANAILEAFGTSADNVASPVREEYAIAYMFRTLPAEETQDLGDENYWECARRLADEVNWRLWEEADTIYFMTDGDIMKSRVEHTITRDAEGVHSVTGQVSTRRPEQEVVIQCDAHRWQAGPGTVCELVGYGPKPTSSHTMTLSGRWLVAHIERSSLFALATTITLHRRQKAKAEPAHDVRQRADASADPSVGLAGGLGPVALGAAAEGTPKDIIDSVVLPIARANGVQRTAAQNDAANAVHGPTSSGGRSDHQGPPDKAWAADMPCDEATGNKLCADLARRFGFPGSGIDDRPSGGHPSGSVGVLGAGSFVRVNRGGYSYQLLWHVEGHYDHVHMGIQRRPGVASTGGLSAGDRPSGGRPNT